MPAMEFIFWNIDQGVKKKKTTLWCVKYIFSLVFETPSTHVNHLLARVSISLA